MQNQLISTLEPLVYRCENFVIKSVTMGAKKFKIKLKLCYTIENLVIRNFGMAPHERIKKFNCELLIENL